MSETERLIRAGVLVILCAIVLFVAFAGITAYRRGFFSGDDS